ncbi:MAG: hypothetical protein VYC34_05385 [Planctomycetota bacterium]|nr:hypothetical protein [Planctomycetota bacterium]
MDYTPSKMLPEMTPDRLASLYRPNRCISVFLYGSPLSDAISHAVEEGIPEEVRGSFIPFDLTIRAGWHDVFETTENPEGQLFVRALFSVRFKGNGTPHDWKETRRRILALPVINETLERLRAPLGDPKVVVYWHA